MGKVVSIGKQNFASLRENQYFFVDKTNFIKEWWEGGDEITLITRPRRFGKTLNMSMLDCFFSNKYSNLKDLFEGLSIWKEEKYRKLQGTYPVIFLSFADVKQTNYKDAVQKIKDSIVEIFLKFEEVFSEEELQKYREMQMEGCGISDVFAQSGLKLLSDRLQRYYGKKAIILLDEYDTPMQEAYIHGY